MELDLSSPPLEAMDENLWRNAGVRDPAVGDLWLLSWDGRALALGVISGVGEGYVLMWPVTLPSEVVFRPAVEVLRSPLGISVFIWPSRETGVGAHMLHRRYGELLPERVMAAVAEAMEQGIDGPLPYAPAIDSNSDIETADDAMIDHWESICLNVWPRSRPGRTPLNREVLRAIGLRPSDLADALDVASHEAVALFNGERSPDTAQLAALESRFGTSPGQLLGAMIDEGARELLSPVWKDDILAVASHLDADEGAARDSLRAEYALAARSSGERRDRMRAAVHRILGRSPK